MGYKELLSEHQSLEPKIPEMLKRAFISFENLHMVTLGYYDDQAVFEEGEELPFLSPPVLQFFRKTLLPVYGGSIPYLYQGEVQTDMHVIRAASLCRPKIDCLNLYTYHRALDFGMLNFSDEDLTIVTDLLKDVSTLAFAIPSGYTHDYHYNTAQSQPFQVLRSASNLRHLDLYGSPIGRPGEFSKFLRECHFGQLHSLGLHLVNVDGKDLIGVVQRHR